MFKGKAWQESAVLSLIFVYKPLSAWLSLTVTQSFHCRPAAPFKAISPVQYLQTYRSYQKLTENIFELYFAFMYVTTYLAQFSSWVSKWHLLQKGYFLQSATQLYQMERHTSKGKGDLFLRLHKWMNQNMWVDWPLKKCSCWYLHISVGLKVRSRKPKGTLGSFQNSTWSNYFHNTNKTLFPFAF